MRKETKIVVFIAVCMAAVFATMVFLFGDFEETTYDVNFQREITVQDGSANPATFSEEVEIYESGNYQFFFKWDSEPGMLTGVRVTDAQGKVLQWVTGECVDAEMQSMYFEKGNYEITFFNLLRAVDFQQFISSSGGEEHVVTDYVFEANKIFVNSYSYKIVNSGTMSVAKTVGILVGLMLGMILCGVIIILTRKGEKGNGFAEARYDERQQIARGKAYQIGFCTAIFYFVAVTISDIMELQIPAKDCVVMFIGIILSLFAWIVYCVKEDAYYALNEKRKTIYVVVLVGGVVNLLIGAINVSNGLAVTDGVLNFGSMNLICGFFVIAVGIVLLIKRLTDSREEA